MRSSWSVDGWTTKTAAKPSSSSRRRSASSPAREEIGRASRAASTASEPLKLTIDAARLVPGLVDELKTVLEHHKGEADVHLAIRTAEGEPREIRLGREYRVRPSRGLRAELDHMLGPDVMAA